MLLEVDSGCFAEKTFLHKEGKLKIVPGQKKSPIIQSGFQNFGRFIDYLTSKLALLANWRASAEALSTEVSSPYPL